MALKPENPVVGGTVLRRAAIQSPNFVTGVSGWTINQDGSAEFNNVTIRGGITIGGTALYYSTPAPQANTLVASIAASGGTDTAGNVYLAGITTYFHGAIYFALQHLAGDLNAYTATTEAGPWTFVNQLSFSVEDGHGTFYSTFSQPIAATGGTPTSPTLITTDSWNAAVLVNSWTGSGSATNGLSYRLTTDNEVRLVGDLTSPGTASVITTLPAGYRPAQGVNVEFSRYDDSGTAHALIAANGTVTMQTVVGSGKGLFCNASIPLDSL